MLAQSSNPFLNLISSFPTATLRNILNLTIRIFFFIAVSCQIGFFRKRKEKKSQGGAVYVNGTLKSKNVLIKPFLTEKGVSTPLNFIRFILFFKRGIYSLKRRILNVEIKFLKLNSLPNVK